MGLGWVFLIRGESGWILLAYLLDHIVSAGSYRISWIVLYRLDHIMLARSYQETMAFMRWLVTGCMGRIGRMDWMGRW